MRPQPLGCIVPRPCHHHSSSQEKPPAQATSFPSTPTFIYRSLFLPARRSRHSPRSRSFRARSSGGWPRFVSTHGPALVRQCHLGPRPESTLVPTNGGSSPRLLLVVRLVSCLRIPSQARPGLAWRSLWHCRHQPRAPTTFTAPTVSEVRFVTRKADDCVPGNISRLMT